MVAEALREYADALQGEEKLRTLLPGVRIVASLHLIAPRQALRRMSEVRGAKQFLGIDLEPAQNDDREDSKGLAAGSVAILAIVSLSQLGLLYMLSFDRMAALGGNPPLSSYSGSTKGKRPVTR